MVPSPLDAQFHSLHNAVSPKHHNKKIVYLHAETDYKETVTMKSVFIKDYKLALGVRRSSFEGEELMTPVLFFFIVILLPSQAIET